MKELMENPFKGGEVVVPDKNSALVEVEQSRAVMETQAAMAIAKRFPRNQIDAMDRILNTCTRQSLAESALYSYARGGTSITGPSIRLAEALAQNWGNLQFGIRELEQRDGVSTVEAFAWDIETNVKQVSELNMVQTALLEALETRIKFDEEEAARKAEAQRLERDRIKQEEERRKFEQEKADFEAQKKADAERMKAEAEARVKADKEKQERIAREEAEVACKARTAAETEAEVERKAREESLRPDKEKILTYMGNLLNVELPKIKDNDTREILKMFHDELNALVFKYKRLVKE